MEVLSFDELIRTITIPENQLRLINCPGATGSRMRAARRAVSAENAISRCRPSVNYRPSPALSPSFTAIAGWNASPERSDRPRGGDDEAADQERRATAQVLVAEQHQQQRPDNGGDEAGVLQEQPSQLQLPPVQQQLKPLAKPHAGAAAAAADSGGAAAAHGGAAASAAAATTPRGNNLLAAVRTVSGWLGITRSHALPATAAALVAEVHTEQQAPASEPRSPTAGAAAPRAEQQLGGEPEAAAVSPEGRNELPDAFGQGLTMEEEESDEELLPAAAAGEEEREDDGGGPPQQHGEGTAELQMRARQSWDIVGKGLCGAPGLCPF